MDILKTALYSLHQKHGAKFVPFAGYQMPIQYSKGIIEEHKSTRENAGIFDVSHMGQLFIKGDDKLAKDLEKIFPAELSKAKLNQSKYSFLMNDEAGIYDDLIITKVEGGFNIVLNAACKNTDFKLLTKLLEDKYEMILSEELSLIAIQGPKAVQILEKIINGVSDLKFMNGDTFNYLKEDIYITRSGYTGEDGFEISRMGIRLKGPKLENIENTNIKSEGLVRGVIQVPADGNPIIMLSDHGTVGGYPKIGVVITADLDLVGQLTPGTKINFKEVSLEEAQNIFKAYTEDTNKYLNECN